MEKIVITYKNSDLDCLASAYAYAEYLTKTGHSASYYIGGVVQKEVKIVCDLFNISLENEVESIKDKEVIVVDTNTLSSVDYVNPKQIIEIIDHHPNSGDIKYCPNATLKLYDIGAVCTVIADMFKNNNIGISRESAILLYYGIISNTVNLKSKVTTQKDVEMLTWLKEQSHEIDEKLIETIFKEKSKVDINNLRRFLEIEEKFMAGEDSMVIGQIELVDALGFLNKNKTRIDQIISEVYNDYNVQHVFINIVDIFNGYHLIYANDNETISFLENKFHTKFIGGVYREDVSMLRKEIKRFLKTSAE